MSTLLVRLQDLITAIGTDYKIIVGRIGDLTSLSTTAKSSVVAAINEISERPSGTGGASIADGDAGTSTTTTYSANKITNLVTSTTSALETKLIGGAGAAFDTFAELQVLMQADDTQTAAIVTALDNRLRLDGTAQTVTTPNQVVARTSIGAQDASAIGNPDTDLVALYTTAKA